MEIDSTIVTIVDTTITCAAWVHKQGETVLACGMRDEFLREWQVPDEIWDTRVAVLADYADRQEGSIAAGYFNDLIT